MELSWDAVGAIAESVGAVAVLLTFAYLAVQIRQNAQSLDRQSDIARAQIQQNRADTAAQMVATITSVPENVDVYVRLLNESNLSKSGLSDVENARMTSILGMFRAQSENTFLQYEQGFLPEDFYRDVGIELNLAWGRHFLDFDMPLTASYRSELLRNLAAQDDT